MIYNKKQREQAITFIDKVFSRDRLLKIDYVKMSKTVSQNAYIWLVFTHIAFETGNNKEDIYGYYLEKFPTFKEIDLFGDSRTIKISMSNPGFDKEKMSVFIDKIVTDARQEGFDIPDPEDLKCKEMYDYYRNLGLI